MRKKKRPQVLDIPDLARRGGLSPKITSTYRMGENEHGGFLAASATSTASVNRAVMGGIEKDVADARHYAQSQPNASPDCVGRSFPTVGTMSNEWIQAAIIDRCGTANHEGTAKEIYQRHEAIAPRLKQWPPVASTERPGRKPSRLTSAYREIIRKLVNKGLEGEEYCLALDAAGYTTHPEWKQYGCPKSFREAWTHSDPKKQKRFRKLIADQKYKLGGARHK